MSNVIIGRFGGNTAEGVLNQAIAVANTAGIRIGADKPKGPSLGDIFNEVLKDSENKKDHIFDPYEVKMGGNGRIYLPGMDTQNSLGFEMNDWSLGQLASRTAIPVRYLRNCPPELQAVNVNYWLRNMTDESTSDWMFRVRQIDTNDIRKGGLVRGIMTEKYSPFDDHEILEIINKIIGIKDGSYTVNWFYRDETGFHLRLTFEDLTTAIGVNKYGQPDIHKIGLHITNSEVGKRSIRITPMVWRLVCTNGLMGWRQEDMFQQRHVGLRPQEMYSRVAEAIGGGLKLGKQMMDTLIASKEFEIPDPFATIDEIAKSLKYSEALTEKMKESFMEDASNTVFGIVQSMTRSAQFFDADRRVEIEEDASKYLRKMITA
jgi:hypothetical protein